jgi:type III restriction enzyme
MTASVSIEYDEALVMEIAARFDLREPNRKALDTLVKRIVEANGEYRELIADLATGVGKTFLMSSLVDYFAEQGVRHVLIVTPGSVIQRKTLANFNEASVKYVNGALNEPTVITPDNYRTKSSILSDPNRLKVFVFNVQQLIRPTDKVSRKVRETNESLGEALYSYLGGDSPLLVIADEHHIYHEKAKAFSAAIRDLAPLALVGLTATPAQSDSSKIVFQYTLGEAIADGHVKVPVIVYRKDGTKDERTQLSDACHLLRQKEAAYASYAATTTGTESTKPVLFVVCSSISHAREVGQILSQEGFLGNPDSILEVTSQSSDEALLALAAVEEPASPIRAIVSVNMLREGWDVKNIAVIVALRRLASQTLTEQILGRGLRLPYSVRTGVPSVDQVDVVAHDSYKQLLAQKDVLTQRVQVMPNSAEVDEHGAAKSAGSLTVPDLLIPTGDVAPEADESAAASQVEPAEPGDLTVYTISPDGSEDAAMFFVETAARVKQETPKPLPRVSGAPVVIFPRREAVLTYETFTLSDIADGDAQAAGARFIAEVPTFLAKDALMASRHGDEVKIRVTPQKNVEAQQVLAGIDTVKGDLERALFREVEETRTERNAARRVTTAFLRGAGVTNESSTAEWGNNRRLQAIAGITSLMESVYAKRKRQMTYQLVPVNLPIEPVLVDGGALDAYNDAFVKHVHFTGWQQNIMPVAAFDAGSTEWALAQMLDRDQAITWWLRVYTNGPAFVPTADGNYFPDFIAVDKDGVKWLIEGKSDKNANDADVLRKIDAATSWARAVRDDGRFGEWHYLFATESHIRQAAGSWAGLKVATDPE